MMTTLASIALATLVTADAERVCGCTHRNENLSAVLSRYDRHIRLAARIDDHHATGGRVKTGRHPQVLGRRHLWRSAGRRPAPSTLLHPRRMPIRLTVYVTWELRSGDGLTIVRLYIDEPDCIPGLRRRPRHHLASDPLRLDREPQQPTSNRASCITPRLNHRSPHRVENTAAAERPLSLTLRDNRFEKALPVQRAVDPPRRHPAQHQDVAVPISPSIGARRASPRCRYLQWFLGRGLLPGCLLGGHVADAGLWWAVAAWA